ncbi:MAG: ribosome-associated protein [Pseudonocardiales bacterium]|jgi:ribosome-associated protein|nr:class peptide chain release factor [Frankiales bacterium]MDQ1691842.1 ribosome-associated protein [Pseudonocardiales bacterium]MDQ1735538.1 ribosome-associated protein [Pseudonocardiales bacterium]
MPAAGRTSPSGDLVVPAGRGLPAGLTIPAAELVERFSRSSGPGGQSVNTTDSRVELRFDVARSAAFTDLQRSRALEALAGRLGEEGVLSIAASEHRSQLQNRVAARARLVNYLQDALEPASPVRRATRPSRGARQRRLDTKRQRAIVKAGRGRVRDQS